MKRRTPVQWSFRACKQCDFWNVWDADLWRQDLNPSKSQCYRWHGGTGIYKCASPHIFTIGPGGPSLQDRGNCWWYVSAGWFKQKSQRWKVRFRELAVFLHSTCEQSSSVGFIFGAKHQNKKSTSLDLFECVWVLIWGGLELNVRVLQRGLQEVGTHLKYQLGCCCSTVQCKCTPQIPPQMSKDMDTD